MELSRQQPDCHFALALLVDLWTQHWPGASTAGKEDRKKLANQVSFTPHTLEPCQLRSRAGYDRAVPEQLGELTLRARIWLDWLSQACSALA